MEALTIDRFAVGERFEMEVDGGRVPVELIAVEPLRDSGREGGSFRLEFRGPFEPVLGQAIYTFRRGDEAVEIFVCPIGREQAGTRYEAVFF